MKPSDFYLCYLRELSESELDLILAYWEFDGTLNEYKYKTSNYMFNRGNNIIPNISNNIGKLAFLSSINSLSCRGCGEKFKATSRNQLKKLVETKPKKCTICLDIEINEIASDKLDSLERCEVDYSVHTNNNVDFNYLDAFFTFTVLHEHADPLTGQINDPKNSKITGNYEHDMQIINSLMDKHFIYEIDHGFFAKTPSFHEDVDYLNRHSFHFNTTNRSRYYEFLAKIPQQGFYIAKPEVFEDYSILIHFLYEDILTKTIGIDETKQLEGLISKMLLQKAYQLLPVVENEFRISIERNLRFETILLYAVKHFTLTQVFNILHYQARLTSSDIRSKPSISRIVHERIYVNNIEKALIKLAKIAEENRFKKNLPDDTQYSTIEKISSRYFLGGVMSWSSLSGKEILSRWLNSLTNEHLAQE